MPVDGGHAEQPTRPAHRGPPHASPTACRLRPRCVRSSVVEDRLPGPGVEHNAPRVVVVRAFRDLKTILVLVHAACPVLVVLRCPERSGCSRWQPPDRRTPGVAWSTPTRNWPRRSRSGSDRAPSRRPPPCPSPRTSSTAWSPGRRGTARCSWRWWNGSPTDSEAEPGTTDLPRPFEAVLTGACEAVAVPTRRPNTGTCMRYGTVPIRCR